MYSYSRARGLFAGIALDGSALTIDRKSNAEFYGRPGVLASEITSRDGPTAPEGGRQFVATLDQMLGIATLPAAHTSTPPLEANTGELTNRQAAPKPQAGDPNQPTTHPMEDQHPGAEPPQ